MSTDKISVWEGEWKKGVTSFHLPEVNVKLLDNLDILLGSPSPVSDTVSAKTVLVPLCGKSKDLVHLHSLGHSVVGVEWIEQACLEFFSENKIEYSVAVLEGVEGSVYTSADGRLRIYQCDFLHLTESLLGGKVDAVWDIQSLVSINPRDRKQYVRTVR